jgi:hypothetical protein
LPLEVPEEMGIVEIGLLTARKEHGQTEETTCELFIGWDKKGGAKMEYVAARGEAVDLQFQ